MPRAKKIVLKEDYEKNLRQYYEDLGEEYGSKRPEGDGRFEWDLIELDWARMSNAPSQADIEREKQEKAEAERLRREGIRKDGIRRRGSKSFTPINDEAKTFRQNNMFEGELDPYHWEMLREGLQSSEGDNRLEDALSVITNVTDKLKSQYETMKHLKFLVSKMKTNVLNDYREGDFDILYEDNRYHKHVKPVMESVFELYEDTDIEADNNSGAEN